MDGRCRIGAQGYHVSVPLLIDGNNLMYAMNDAGMDVGREGLCRILARVAGSEPVRVVFDGPPRRQGPDVPDGAVEVLFSQRRKADDVIAELIAADTAPRRLTVVSTDHEIRRAARRRRCRTVTSEDFTASVARRLARPKRPPAPEPPEKRAGLTPEQTRQWLKELHLETEDDDETRI